METNPPHFGKHEMFPTRQRHLNFRTITYLLAHTQAIDGPLKSERTSVIGLSRNMQFKLNLLTGLNQLTVRHNESTALVHTPYTPGNHSRVTVTKQPDNDNAVKSRSALSDTTIVPAVTASFVKEDINDWPRNDRVFKYFIRSLREWRNLPHESSCDVRVQYPFAYEKHCHILVELLRIAWNQHSAPGLRLQRINDFQHYVLLASNSTILSNFTATSTTNIPKYLTKSMQELQFVANLHTTLRFQGTDSLPTTSQLSVLREEIRRFLVSVDVIGESESEKLFENLRNKPLYDLDGRLRFHAVFSCVYKAAVKTLTALQMELSKNVPLSETWIVLTELTTVEYLDTISSLLTTVWDTLRLWRLFLDEFRVTISAHLFWLQRIFDPTESNFAGRHTAYLAATSAYFNNIETLLPPLNQESETSAVKVMRSFVQNFEFRALRVSPETRDKQMTKPADYLSTLDMCGKTLTEDEKTAIFEWLGMNASSEYAELPADRARRILECTDFHGNYHCESSNIALCFLANLKTSQYVNNAAEEQDEMLLLPSFEVIKHYKNMIRLPPHEATRRRKHRPTRICLAGSCCASCWHVIRSYNEKHRVPNKVSFHTASEAYSSGFFQDRPPAQCQWTEADLPPWLLRESAEYVIEEARGVLIRRLDKIVEEMKRSKAVSPSTTPRE